MRREGGRERNGLFILAGPTLNKFHGNGEGFIIVPS